MPQSMRFGLILLLLAGLFAALTPAWAQEVTAGIVGTVVDPSGAPIKDATVTATDSERGTVWTVKTNDSGTYNILRVPVGNYTVKVVAPGFQTAVHPAFTLVLNQTARVDVAMKMGQVSESVEVTGDTPALQTESTQVSTLIDSNTVTSVPLAGRNYLQLALLAPGTTNNNPEGIRNPQNLDNSSRPFINGNREQANQYFLDGQLNSEDKNNETAYTPSVDAVQEFNVITQNASAEFGTYEGGVVSVSIKSGTNNFHGSLFEFLRNDALDANKPSNGWSRGVLGQENIPGQIVPGHAADGTIVKPEFRYNEFGATFGGPIVKNKVFFFVDYQGLRDVNAGATGAQLLTQRMRTGDFGQLCQTGFTAGICNDRDSTGKVINQLVDPENGNQPFLSNLIPSTRISPVVNNLITQFPKLYPVPQIDTANGNNFFFNSGSQIFTDQGDLKIDYNASNKDHVFGRWSQMHLRNPAFSGCLLCAAGSAQGADQPIRNAVVDWTHTFNPHLLNEARIGFNAVRFDQNLVQTSPLGNIGEQLGITNANFEAPGLLNIQIAGNGQGAEASLGQLNLVQIFHSTQGQFIDNLIMTHGRHSIKTGFQFVRLRQDWEYNGNNGALGSLTVTTDSGSGLADFYLGRASAGGLRDTDITPTVFGDRGNIYAAYVQDDWRVTDTLTLNLGVRFEDHTPLWEVHDRVVNFGLFSGTIYTPDGRDGTARFGNRALYNNYLGVGDWEPRFGFAWSPAALGGKTVIRGGYAISAFFEGGGANEQLSINPPFGIIQQTSAGGVGGNTGGLAAGYSAPATCTTIDFTCYQGKRIRIIDQNLRPALTRQWNFTIQRQLGNTVTAQVGYVGQKGSHLLNFQDLQQLIGLNAAGKVAKPGELIVNRVPGPFIGGGNPSTNPPTTLYEAGGILGANMSNADQRYDALQAVLQKRMGNGLQGQVAYTYSKCLSNSPGYFGTGWGSTNATSSGGQPGWQNIYNPRADWGPCFYDQTHVFTSYVTYQLPVGRGRQFGRDLNPALGAVIGNWEIGGIISAHTGNALTLNQFGGWSNGNGDPSNTRGIGAGFLSERPSCPGRVHVVKKRVNATPTSTAYIQWFNPGDVLNAAPDTFGTCSVGNIRGPNYADVDLSLHKDFRITEGKTLQFRFEALNAFNHPVWTFSGGPSGGSFDTGSFVPDPQNPCGYGTAAGPCPTSLNGSSANSSNPNFGNITGSQSARSLQFGLKFIF